MVLFPQEGASPEPADNLFVNHHAPAEITGFHGCTRAAAEAIIASQQFLPSVKEYDWLGDGFYFWEYAPRRAMEWAEAVCTRSANGSEPCVLRATIHLGNCLNLLDTEHMQLLTEAYDSVVEYYQELGRPLPINTATGAHFLDRQVVNLLCQRVEIITGKPFLTIRGCFPEGTPIYPQSKILSKTHVQIAVRDPACITNLAII